MMLWLLVVVVVSCGCVVACPEGCFCHHDQGVYSASCSVLPPNGGKLEALTVMPSLPHSSPLELTDGQFNQARHLKYLSLRNNSIYFIHKKAFYGPKGLMEIDLSFNYIEELDPMLFQHLTSLTTLIFRGNPIQLVPEVPFVVSNSIQHLDIGQCRLKSIPRGILYGLKRLRYLSVDGNFLKSLKYNSLPKGLKYLNLSRNLIVNVPTEVLSVLSNLRRINLGGNPINCSCSLMNFQDWLSGRGVIFDGSVICALPDEYSGTSWSKIDENKLCLAEAMKDELSRSMVHSKTLKTKLTKEKYFQNENNYSEENLQSDQPQSLHPDTESEVLFQNDDTIAMGEMMRDQEVTTVLNEKEASTTVENDGKQVIVKNVSSIDIHKNSENDGNKVEDGVLNMDGDKSDMNQTVGNNNITKVLDNPLERDTHSVDLDEKKKSELPQNSSSQNEEPTSLTTSKQPVGLSETSTIEYKEASGEEIDELKQEGFFVDGDKHTDHANITSEESTDYPETEDTPEDIASTQETLAFNVENNSNLDEIHNFTSLPETREENSLKNYTDNEVVETIPPPVMVPDLTETDSNYLNSSQSSTPVPNDVIESFSETPGTSENKSFIDTSTSAKNAKDNEIKEVAGAEVLMFCIGVLVICLMLYSVYKCRHSKKRQNVRVNKDVESNRGTEMQDMASLLPKPQGDEDKKSNFKYPAEDNSNENEKLINKNNDNGTPNFKSEDPATNKVEEKNTLNNNTSSSPTIKTPLLKPGNQIVINPAAPIQRTKVRVGIIPDSIPRTPIFVQKTYNNGTKHV